MSTEVTSIYAVCLVILFLTLSARVIIYRRANRIGLGDQGDAALLKRMRAHANCAEYAPFGLLLLLLVEQQAGLGWVHVLGLLLLSGRIAHAIGFSRYPQILQLRVAGMVATLAMFVLSGFILLVGALS